MVLNKIQQLNTTTYKITPKDDPKDRIEVIIGDDKEQDFKPQVKLMRWDNEANFSVRLIDDDTKTPKIKVENGKIKYIKSDREVHFYQTKQNKERRSGQALKLKDNYDVKIKENKGVHRLIIDEVPVMYDSKLEIEQMEEGARLAFGDVLIGGLGFGIIQKILLENPKVKSITTIEISQEVIDLIKKENPELFNEKHKVIRDDFYSFCQKTDLKFDYVYGDIWSSVPNIDDWNKFEENTELVKKEGGIIDCWGKEKAFEPLEERDVFEFDVTLKEKPKTNKIVFNLETKGLKFSYQSELTEEEKKTTFRPENVMGSYAVYHESKQGDYSQIGGKNYQAGKAFHIYRPRIKDSVGNEVWGKLNIDEKKGILSVEIPQEFLDNAVYPVRQAAGLNFGYDTQGGGFYTTSGNSIIGSLFTGAAGTGVSISAYLDIRNTDDSFKYNVYLHSDLSQVSNAQTAEYTGQDGAAWYTRDFGATKPTFEAVDYVIVYWADVTDARYHSLYFYCDAGAVNQHHYQALAYGTWPDPFVALHNVNNYKFSIYATYELGVVVPTVTTQAVSVIEKTTATGNGNITDDGGATATRGMCWDTSSGPLITDSHATNGTGEGAYTVAMTGLDAGTKYYVRAYSINSEGTSYGSEVNFTTLEAGYTSPLPAFRRQ